MLIAFVAHFIKIRAYAKTYTGKRLGANVLLRLFGYFSKFHMIKRDILMTPMTI